MILSDVEIVNQIKSLHLQWKSVDGWLEKQIEFENFDKAFDFMKSVADICKKHNHHPFWTNNYKQVSIKFRTNDAGGITQRDIDVAKEIDSLEKNT